MIIQNIRIFQIFVTQQTLKFFKNIIADSLYALGLKLLTYLISFNASSIKAQKRRKLSKPQDLESIVFQDYLDSFILQVNVSIFIY